MDDRQRAETECHMWVPDVINPKRFFIAFISTAWVLAGFPTTD